MSTPACSLCQNLGLIVPALAGHMPRGHQNLPELACWYTAAPDMLHVVHVAHKTLHPGLLSLARRTEASSATPASLTPLHTTSARRALSEITALR